MILKPDVKKYEDLLREIAYIQSEMFSLRFNWRTKELTDFPKKIFGRSKVEKEYLILSQRLIDTKNILREIYDVKPEEEELLWWNVPYENTERYLLYNLLEIKSFDDWRFEYKWETLGNEEKKKIIILVEEGHCSRFSSETYEYRTQDSSYTDSEKHEIIEKFNSKMDKKRKKDIFWDDGTTVKSYTGTIYNSITDYYDSWEYKTDRKIANDIYARSLYVDHRTQIKNVVSNSVHYKCIFEIGAFHFKNDIIDGLMWHPFQLKAGGGDLPQDLENKYNERSALIAAVGFIKNLDWIKHVNIDAFNEKFDNKTGGLKESVIWSAVFTCIGKKMF